MSKDWTDGIMADSDLPDDDFTWTEGSNYGLDGFHFDQTMNEGVLDGARLPEVKGLAGLPDGFIGKESGFDFNPDDILFDDDEVGTHLAFTEETVEAPSEDSHEWSEQLDAGPKRTASSLSDLDWLDPTMQQNPERLPVNPVDKGIANLEEAWGVNRRTDGIHLVPNKDKEIAEYENSLDEGPKAGLPEGRQAQEKIKEAIRWAFRQADRGASLQSIRESLICQLGHQARFTRKAVQQIEEDRGLAGNVFIYGAMYPDIHRGQAAKRKAQLRKLRARYVVVPEGDERLSVWQSLGKVPVTKVPWKKALAFYGPRLKATGHRLASGNPRSVLQQAFLQGPEKKTQPQTNFPTHVPPADRVSSREARQAIRTAPAIPRQVISRSDRQEELDRKKALVQIAKWVKAGQLTQKQAHELARSEVSPKMLLRTAGLLISANPSSDYKGPTFKTSQQVSTPKSVPAPDPLSKAAKAHSVDVRELRNLVKWARIKMTEGTLGHELDQLLKLRFSKPLLKAGAEPLRIVRRQHEGLSGHLYVDAGAYASKRGVEGCERGALQQRSGNLKTVLAMDRCGSCVFKNADGVCQKYNKLLVDSAPVDNPKEYQKESIRLANASDSEVTASLFSPTFDPSDFSLTDPLQEISLHEAASTEELGEVLFGTGIEIE